MLFLAKGGYRCIAHDRRATAGPASLGTEMTWTFYADELAELVEQLDLYDGIHIGHSTFRHTFCTTLRQNM
jgi:non-heme chloroperoxidase